MPNPADYLGATFGVSRRQYPDHSMWQIVPALHLRVGRVTGLQRAGLRPRRAQKRRVAKKQNKECSKERPWIQDKCGENELPACFTASECFRRAPLGRERHRSRRIYWLAGRTQAPRATGFPLATRLPT